MICRNCVAADNVLKLRTGKPGQLSPAMRITVANLHGRCPGGTSCDCQRELKSLVGGINGSHS